MSGEHVQARLLLIKKKTFCAPNGSFTRVFTKTSVIRNASRKDFHAPKGRTDNYAMLMIKREDAIAENGEVV